MIDLTRSTMSLFNPGRLLLSNDASSRKHVGAHLELVLAPHVRHLITSTLRRAERGHGDGGRGRWRLGIRGSHGFRMRLEELRVDGKLGGTRRIRVRWRGGRSRRETVVRVHMHVVVIIRWRPVDHESGRVHPGRWGRQWVLHRRRWRKVRWRRRVRLRAGRGLHLGRSPCRRRARRRGGTRWGRRRRRTLDTLLLEHVLQRLPHLRRRVGMLRLGEVHTITSICQLYVQGWTMIRRL
ncbi:hypothetical protein CALCODRAFT_545105 [Calocera cornea HHB12733]|uniref:Uncharacterized protein n=1 Tax=Calocera cornea HHB12733 TaxID=1353952 RepID=A0A165EYP1_9BASI|nr:hypothetical protein CALCODRAFT_545105 [Calocera cornea HHB12733]